MDTQAVWAHIHAERRALAANLADLTPEQWQADSLCAGLDGPGRRRPRDLPPADRLGADAGDGGPEPRSQLQRDDLPRGQAHGCELDPRVDPRRLRRLRRLHAGRSRPRRSSNP